MRKLLLLLTLPLLMAAYPTDGNAQGHAFGVTGVGTLMQDGEHPQFAYFIGGDIPIYSDSASGFSNKTRTSYYYVNTPAGQEEIQAMQIWNINSKRFATSSAFLSDWTVSIGIGISNEINDGEDDVQQVATKLELGATLVKAVKVYIGGDVIPRSEKPNQGFLYFGLTLIP